MILKNIKIKKTPFVSRQPACLCPPGRPARALASPLPEAPSGCPPLGSTLDSLRAPQP